MQLLLLFNQYPVSPTITLGGGSNSVAVTGKKALRQRKQQWLFYSAAGSTSTTNNSINRGGYVPAITVRNQQLS